MAEANKRHPLDRGGGWFVDTTCIDCDVARQVAPGLIAEADDGRSYFVREPSTPEEEAMAWCAVLGCPTASVGAPRGTKPPMDVYPHEVAPGVFLTGYNARESFGSNAYFMPRHDGNLLVDAPRWTPHLWEWMKARGGLAHVLLTHRDDVAAYDRYAEASGARVWIHEDDADAAPRATDVFRGDVEPVPGVRAIEVPGHTQGSVCWLVDERLLFTGDSLHWSRTHDDLGAFRGAAWHSWQKQIESLTRLADEARFERVLPGHGDRGQAPADDMTRRLRALVERMRNGTHEDAW